MKKNPFFWMLTAALVCGLSLTVTSCSDDDNDDNNNKPVSNETVIGGDITDDLMEEYGWSRWFLPSVGQFVKGLVGLKYKVGRVDQYINWDDDYNRFERGGYDDYNNVILRSFLGVHGVKKAMLNGTYWTSSEGDESTAYCLTFAEGQPIRISESGSDATKKTLQHKARPFIAIK